MSTLMQIQDWYRSVCDDNWEHTFGVKIDTLDNPGWSVTIDLADTPLEKKEFAAIAMGVGEGAHPTSEDWIVCRKEAKQFRAFGGPAKLEEMLQIFLHGKDEEPNQTPQTTRTFGPRV